jgi:pyruvate dehydrogenase E2 component (dihydrolipoamide acetyltransferase)
MGAIEKLVMPKWGLSMTEGKVVKWLIEEGASVDAGAELVDIETEKISSAAEAPAPGLLRRRVAQEGEVVPVAGLLGVIADASVPDSDVEAFVQDFLANFVPEEVVEGAEGLATETVELGGRKIRYLKKGEEGEPAILIHGFGGDLNNWLFNHDALAEERAVYALDLPGHGESSKDVGEGGAGAFAGVLADFMDALGIAKAHLIGHSMGGAVALELALADPSRARSITLIASAGLGPELDAAYIEGFVGAARRKEIKPHLEKLFADPSLVSRQLVDDILKFKRLDGVDAALRTVAGALMTDGVQTTVLRDRLGDLGVPLLVIWGEEDRIIPASQARDLPGAPRVEIFAAGHMVQMEAASEVNGLIKSFLGSL